MSDDGCWTTVREGAAVLGAGGATDWQAATASTQSNSKPQAHERLVVADVPVGRGDGLEYGPGFILPFSSKDQESAKDRKKSWNKFGTKGKEMGVYQVILKTGA